MSLIRTLDVNLSPCGHIEPKERPEPNMYIVLPQCTENWHRASVGQTTAQWSVSVPHPFPYTAVEKDRIVKAVFEVLRTTVPLFSLVTAWRRIIML